MCCDTCIQEKSSKGAHVFIGKSWNLLAILTGAVRSITVRGLVVSARFFSHFSNMYNMPKTKHAN